MVGMESDLVMQTTLACPGARIFPSRDQNEVVDRGLVYIATMVSKSLPAFTVTG